MARKGAWLGAGRGRAARRRWARQPQPARPQTTREDFLDRAPETGISAIITNPPYALAQEFIECALHLDDTRMVAMLLRTDFEHAARRTHLFADCAMFAKKVVLTKRIRWFEDSVGSPSFNHCWTIWDRQHRGAPTLAYASHD
jgi:hypothetical protein